MAYIFVSLIISFEDSLVTEMRFYKQKQQPTVPSFLTFPTVSNLQPFFETIRNYIKTGYRTYLLLNPEVKMGQCVVKYFYTQYPNVLKFFRVQNLTKFIRRLYSVVTKYANDIMSGNLFSDTDRKRVESKVASITHEKENQQFYYVPYYQFQPDQSNNNYQSYLLRSKRYYNLRKRFVRQAPNYEFRQSVKKSKVDQSFLPPLIDNVPDYDVDSDATIDLSDRTLEREADQLFNVDSMFWKSLGIEENSLKKYSLSYCAKDYVTDVFKRFIKNVILS